MPNWCGNKLDVFGPQKELNRFRKIAKASDSELSFNNFIPMPDALNKTTFPSNEDNWYDWRYANWGIKWDVVAEVAYKKSNTIEYIFDSPWGPPIRAIEKISKEFSKLRFELEYSEPGMSFCGQFKCFDGEIESDKNWEMKNGLCPHCKEHLSIPAWSQECDYCDNIIKGNLLPVPEE